MREFISVQEAAQKAGITKETFYHHIDKGNVPYTRVDIMGKANYQIPTLEFIEWLRREASKKQGKVDQLVRAMEELKNGR
jgi:excisionase family DNA binding protein